MDFWEDSDLETTDPAYVGAWWLCFLFGCVISWLLAIPFLMFPRLLPNSHLVKKEREEQMAQSYKEKVAVEKENSSVWNKVKSLPRDLLLVVTMLTWLCLTIGTCFSAFAITGVAAFSHLYYQAQFNLTASTASIAAGFICELTFLSSVLYYHQSNL